MDGYAAIALQPVESCFSKIFYLFPAFTSSNDGCNGKEQDIEQWIEGLGALASVVNVGQVLGKDIKAHDLGRKLGI